MTPSSRTPMIQTVFHSGTAIKCLLSDLEQIILHPTALIASPPVICLC